MMHGSGRHDRAGVVSLVRLPVLWLLFAVSIAHTQTAPAASPLPTWAVTRWTAFAQAQQVRRVDQIMPSLLLGDFNGDGVPDIAILVEHIGTHKTGIVFLHQGQRTTYLVGAGRTLGNGGDDFRWMGGWRLATRTPKSPRADQLIVERESSASGLIFFARDRYRWKQLGD